MRFDDFLKFVIKSLMHRKLRTWLTVLGIVIGVTIVVALVSLSSGMQKTIDAQFQSLGANRIMVTPGQGGFGVSFGFSSAKLTDGDRNVISRVSGVEYTGAFRVQALHVEFEKQRKTENIGGVVVDKESLDMFKTVGFLAVEEGRFLEEGDNFVAVVGYGVAHGEFDKNISVGDNIKIKDRQFKVIGIHKRSGNPGEDNVIRIPVDAMRAMSDDPTNKELTTIIVTAKPDYDIDQVAETIKEKLRKFRNVKKDEEDFNVATSEQLISTFKQALAVVQIFLISIAGISFVVGGIGVTTTMVTAVFERTKEIGILKSIGATNKFVQMLYMTESGLLALLGGVIGILIGSGIALVAELIAKQQGLELFSADINFTLIFGSLIIAFIVGVISGYYPARIASKLNPIEAIRKY